METLLNRAHEEVINEYLELDKTRRITALYMRSIVTRLEDPV